MSPALHVIFHTPMARCSLFVLKVPISTNQPTCCTAEDYWTDDFEIPWYETDFWSKSSKVTCISEVPACAYSVIALHWKLLDGVTTCYWPVWHRSAFLLLGTAYFLTDLLFIVVYGCAYMFSDYCVSYCILACVPVTCCCWVEMMSWIHGWSMTSIGWIDSLNDARHTPTPKLCCRYC